MATRPMSGITADTDVNLDFLTKEEKEALLSKKMDMIRQRNKALTERHKLIEADKKKAEEAGQAVKPTIDSQTLPAEGIPKPRGRGRGLIHNKDVNKPAKERPKSSGDVRDSSNYEPIVDTSDLANYRSKGHGGPLYDRDTYNNTPKNKRKPAIKEEATAFSNNFEYEPIIDMKDLDKRFGALLNTVDAGSLPHTDHGPPPDPSFNPLADRRRSDKKEESLDHRRHPRNYGGSTDLSRVKQSMKNMREKEREKPQGNKPLDIVMTGKERRNHEEWKAERDRYDKERIQRQMSDGGNWKRAWDADKSSQENEDQSASSCSKIEPAKRPAGRIGSGRFDRGERDERPRSAVIPKGALQLSDHPQQPQRQHHHEQHQQVQLQNSHIHPQPGESKPTRGRGRGRGRGRSRGSASGEKFPRPRTWSGSDDRFVECQKELLLVKFDNTAGDNSVEVEYDDNEFLSLPASPPKVPQSLSTTPGRGPTGRTPNQTSKQQSRGNKSHQQKSKAPQHKERPHSDAQHAPLEDKWKAPATSPVILDEDTFVAYASDETQVRTSSHSQSYGDSEDWEDCTESSGMNEEDNLNVIQLSSNATDPHMLLECRLNPEAPEFLPSSPDLVTSPLANPTLLPWLSNDSISSPLSHGSVTSQQSQHLEKLTIVPTDSRLSPDDQRIIKKTQHTNHLKDDKSNLIPQIPKCLDTTVKYEDMSTCLQPSNGSGEINDVTNVLSASNGCNGINKAKAEFSSLQIIDTIGHVSPFLVKGMKRNSSDKELKDTSKEPTTVPEIPQDGQKAKYLLQEVPKIQDPATDNLKNISVFVNQRTVNGGVLDEHNVSNESTFADQQSPQLENTTRTLSEGYGRQENHAEPSGSLASKDGHLSGEPTLAGLTNSLMEGESAQPTADISTLS